MIKYSVIAFVFITSFFFTCASSPAQNANPDQVKQQLEMLEKLAKSLTLANEEITHAKEQTFEERKEILKDMREILLKDHEIKKDELVRITERHSNTIYLFLGIIAAIFAIEFIGIFITVKKNIEKKVVDSFVRNFNVSKSQLNPLLKDITDDFKLRQSKKILVLSSPGNDDFIKRFFYQMGFINSVSGKLDHIIFKTFDEQMEIGNNYDLVLFNNDLDSAKLGENKKKIETHLMAYPEKTTKFYFGPPPIFKDQDERTINNRAKVSFSNARTQLYGNLMNALRYQDKLLQ